MWTYNILNDLMEDWFVVDQGYITVSDIAFSSQMLVLLGGTTGGNYGTGQGVIQSIYYNNLQVVDSVNKVLTKYYDKITSTSFEVVELASIPTSSFSTYIESVSADTFSSVSNIVTANKGRFSTANL